MKGDARMNTEFHENRLRLLKYFVKISRKTGIFNVYGFVRKRLVNKQIAIIAYHRIDRMANFPWSLEPTSQEDFESEIRYLRKNYQIISLDQLITGLNDFDALPKKAAIVTIDDGYKDAYINAYPVLRKYEIPAIIFLTTGYIDTGKLFWWDKIGYILWETKLETIELGESGTYHFDSFKDRHQLISMISERFKKLPEKAKNEVIERLEGLCGVTIPSDLGNEVTLSWDEVKIMSENGISFGSHTVNHPILTNIPLDLARKEITDSKAHIENEIDKEVTSFCYPNGGSNDYNDEIIDILKMNSFKCAFSYSPASFLSHKPSPYKLPRIPGGNNLDTFELVLSGLYYDSLSVRRCL